MERLISLLKQACDRLRPFTLQVSPGALVYNGNRYAPTPPRECDPYALAWWSSIRTIIALLAESDTLTRPQFTYLRDTFCGGMGSFSDFSLSQQRWGESAAKANSELDEIRSSLHYALNQLQAKVT